MNQKEIALKFAEAILENHEESKNENITVWRYGVVLLAKEFLKLKEEEGKEL